MGKKLSNQFLIYLTCPVILASAIIIGASIGVLYMNVPDWIKPAQDLSVMVEKQKMWQQTLDKRLDVDDYFLRIDADLSQTASYLNGLFDNSITTTTPYESYNGVTNDDPRLPPGGLDANGKNFETSVWFNKFNTDPNQYNVRLTSSMDNSWRVMSRTNDGYQSLYLGLTDGLFRSYPYTRLDNFVTLVYNCLPSGTQTTMYDPRCRSWYQDAKDNVAGDTIFTSLYIDASTGQPLFTAAQKIITAGVLRGVVAADVSMQSFSESILQAHIAGDGYMYLMDLDGQIILHPRGDFSRTQEAKELEFDSVEERDQFQKILDDQIKQTNSGQLIINRNGQPWILTYERASNVDYVVVTMISEKTLKTPSEEVKDEAFLVLYIIGGIMIGMFLLVSLCGSCQTIRYGRELTGRIRTMTDQFESATKRFGDVEMGYTKPRSKEEAELGDDLKRVAATIRYTARYYDSKNVYEALRCMVHAEKMMNEIGNTEAAAIVQNNMGNAYKRATMYGNHLDMSEMNFRKAIKSAEEKIRHTNEEIEALGEAKMDTNEVAEEQTKLRDLRDELRAFLIILGNRWDNFALLMQQRHQIEPALATFNKAIKMHEEAENYLGVIKATGNKAMYLMELDRADEAEVIMKECFDSVVRMMNHMITKMEATPPSAPEFERLTNRYWHIVEQAQYSGTYYAMTLQRQNNYEQAFRHAIYVLKVKNEIPIQLYNTVLTTLYNSMKAMDHPATEEIKSLLVLPKELTVLLDVSASMGQEKILKDPDTGETLIDPRTRKPLRRKLIVQCQSSLGNLIKNHVSRHDKIHMFTFDDTVTPLVPNMQAATETNKDALIAKINRVGLGSGTAFYNAVHMALTAITPKKNINQFVVVFTDGEDFSSHAHPPYATPPKIIKLLEQKKSIHLIILTVGSLKQKYLELMTSLCQRTKHSMHHHITAESGLHGIEKAFENLARHMNGVGQEHYEILI